MKLITTRLQKEPEIFSYM